MRHDDAPLPQPPRRDRPADVWMCGWCGEAGAEGSCDGPSEDGRCGRSAEPCRPVRTWLGRRRAARNVAVCFGVGMLLLTIAGPGRRERMAPGPLAEPHAQILAGATSNDRCAACHPAARGSFADWFGTGGTAHANLTQTDLCLECHHTRIDPDRATWAHNLDAAQLAAVTASLRGGGTGGAHIPPPPFGHDNVQCAACHREHGGKDVDLAAMTNRQCQTCHSQQFASLSDGHPDWGDWPYGRGGQIAFDHASHFGKHFPANQETFDCRACHDVSTDGHVMRSGSFESTCARCHAKPLEVQLNGGVDLVTLPVLDMLSLHDAGRDPGVWPEDADGVEPLRLSALTEALLIADPDARQAIDYLRAPAANLWAGPASPTRMQRTETLAAAVRTLVNSLAKDLHAEVQRRLGTDAVAGQLSPQTIRDAYARWFEPPEAGSPSSAVDAQSRDEPEEMLPRGGWYRDDLRLAIRYRASGHADPVIRALVEASVHPQVDPAQRALLAETTAARACQQCHADVRAGDPTSWTATRPAEGQHLFTRFSHRPHMNLHSLADCTHCHAVASAAATASEPASHGFMPLTRGTCATCHTAEAAGDACIKCHTYHVDWVEP